MVNILLNLLTFLGIMIVGSIIAVVGFTIIGVLAFLIRCIVIGIKAPFKKDNNKNDRR